MLKVFFYASVQDHSGCEELEIEEVETLADCIDKLEEKLGSHFKDYLLGEDTCFFLVNGKSILRTGGLNTPLHPHDKIEILPVVEAG